MESTYNYSGSTKCILLTVLCIDFLDGNRKLILGKREYFQQPTKTTTNNH